MLKQTNLSTYENKTNSKLSDLETYCEATQGKIYINQDFQNEVQANLHLEQNRLSNPLNDEIVLEEVQDPQPKRRTKRKRRLAPKLREQFE